MFRVTSLSLACFLVFANAFAAEPATRSTGPSVENAWARATPPGVAMGAAYAIITNDGPADRLLSVETAASERVELHNTTQIDGRMQMRHIATLDVPSRARITLEPSGMHLMLVNLKQPLRSGEQVPLTFVFEKAGRIVTRASIAPLGSTRAPTADNAHAHH